MDAWTVRCLMSVDLPLATQARLIQLLAKHR
jgi:hypothetical protein